MTCVERKLAVSSKRFNGQRDLMAPAIFARMYEKMLQKMGISYEDIRAMQAPTPKNDGKQIWEEQVLGQEVTRRDATWDIEMIDGSVYFSRYLEADGYCCTDCAYQLGMGVTYGLEHFVPLSHCVTGEPDMEEFSTSSCEICHSSLAGARYGFITEDAEPLSTHTKSVPLLNALRNAESVFVSVNLSHNADPFWMQVSAEDLISSMPSRNDVVVEYWLDGLDIYVGARV